MATNSNILSFTYDGSPVFYTLNTVLGVQHNETSASTASTLAEYTLGKDISPLISMRRLLNNMGAKGHITSISAIPTVSASSDMSMMFAFNESLSAIDITSLEELHKDNQILFNSIMKNDYDKVKRITNAMYKKLV